MKSLMIRSMVVTLVVLLATVNVFAEYNVVNRLKLLEDKLKTEDMMRPFGHDFLIDVNAAANKNITEFVDDAGDIADLKGTDSEKIDNAITILDKYIDTEQTARLGVNLGIPLPSFTAWGVDFVPDFRVNVGLGVNLAIREETLTPQKLQTIISDYLGDDVPSDIVACASKLTDTQLSVVGGDIAKAIGELPSADCSTQIKLLAKAFEGKYFAPTGVSVAGKDVPYVDLFTKADAKAGFLINYKKDEYFGYLKLYGLYRRDFKIRLAAESLVNDRGIFDGAKEENTQTFATMDYKLGYKKNDFSIFGLIEEIKLKRVSDSLDKGGDLKYKVDPLFRLHSEYLLDFWAFSLKPFVGMHKRNGYDFQDGVYGGADLGAYIWGDRLGLQFRGMLDSEHLTLSPRVKLWLMQLEYSLKRPTKDRVDGIKVSTLHSLDFRLFF